MGTGFTRAQVDAAAKHAAADNAGLVAGLAAAEVASSLTLLENSVARTAAAPGILPVFDRTAGCNLLFGAIGVFPTSHLDLLAFDGSVICSSATAPSSGAGYRDATWLAAAARGAMFAAPVGDTWTGGRSAVSAVPVAGRGIVAGFVDLAGLGPTLAARFGGPDAHEFIITTQDSATVIGRSIDPVRWAGASLGGLAFAGSTDSERPDVDGVQRIYGQAAVAGRGWNVYAGADRARALADTNSVLLADILVNSAMLLVLLVATLLVYRAITRPILGLSVAVRSRASGNAVAMDPDGPKEIAGLTADFNAMVATVASELGERQSAEARVRGILDAAFDAIVGMDESGVVVEWNHEAEKIFGYPCDEAVGRPLVELIIPERYRTRHVEGLARYLATGEAHVLGRRVELEAVASDGHEFPVELSIAPVVTADGKMFSASIRDLTERRAAERTHASLEERLHLSERLESVGRLVGGIAHDFNNLLAIVLNYTDFVAKRLPPEDPNQDDLTQIRGAAERATAFTRQLLTFAKRGAIQPEDVSLNGLIEGLRDLLRRTLPESIGIDLRLAQDLWAVHADRARLEQVLLNVVINAGDAMPGGGRIIVATSNVEHDADSAAQLAELTAGRYVLLTITDTGHGMSKDVIDRAFEPFFTTKEPGKGTGLGLATAYGIVQQAGGRISIYSEVGKGTSIRILLPASTADVAALAGVSPRPAALAAPHVDARILLVEDELGVREAAQRILRSAGYEVLTLGRPDDALAVAKSWTKPLDLLLTDMVMPEMSGRELARRLRIQRPEIRVLYMTGYSQELLGPAAEDLDGAVIQKPFTREPLLAAVAEALRDVDPVPA